MNKIKIRLCILLFISLSFSVFAKEKTLKVMSFNVRGSVYASNRNYENNKWINIIAETIKEANADIVLFQEVFPGYDNEFSEKVIELLKRGSWDYRTSFDYAYKLSDGTPIEKGKHNVVLFNTKRVKLKKDIGATTFFNSKNKNRLKYKFQNNNVQVLEFSFNENDFILVNVHLPGPDRQSDIEKEKKELAKIYQKYKDRQSRRSSIIIGGDFNSHRASLQRYSSSFSDAKVDGTEGIFAQDTQFQRTTLKSACTNAIGLNNDYDHFIVSGIEIIKDMRIVYYPTNINSKFCNTPIKIGPYSYTSSADFYNEVSDHLPIVIELELKNR